MEFEGKLSATRSRLDVIRLADTLKDMHRLPPRPAESAPLDPFAGLERGIFAAQMLDLEQRRWLVRYLAELRGRWNGLPDGRSRCVIHGSTRVDSVLTGDDDCATPAHPATVGPPEWDLVPMAMAYWSFGWLSTAQYGAFCHTYGQDVARCGRFYLLRDIQEFAMTLAAATAANEDFRLRAQAGQRLASIRGDLGPRPWPGWLPIER